MHLSSVTKTHSWDAKVCVPTYTATVRTVAPTACTPHLQVVSASSMSSSLASSKCGRSIRELTFNGIMVRVCVRGGLAALRRCGAGANDVEATREAGGWRTILHSVSGGAQATHLMGLLGPSGGGKSTLFNVLTGTQAGWRARCLCTSHARQCFSIHV